ncbi:hypothetical protein TBLA_0H02660 [Henningerozyma blattae CBS 6284]|uniref:Uncharacterized protein n=1 Tax=Henningerozyma blattae (strain ATCC 34711 / CBS 6284 / DSM 70876 / NBRC 10599 / NRRL Y-10934 / UCD 77-7) TaxID=1071380 RepID=I2H848_HENB6|nr:hypothetical protein TBLA_0H02660 [Tetrapisispora blattae CBS 6284]CCH62550.1 hypothetical protein TBLA_0H02660 [Tetrapisispora blattae CBS 6284]
MSTPLENIIYLKVHSRAILEVNYQYAEVSSQYNQALTPQCYLLLGENINIDTENCPIDESDTDKTAEVFLSDSIHLPLLSYLNERENILNFSVNKEQIFKRLELFKVTHQSLQPMALLLLNKNIFNYDSLILQLLEIFPSKLQWLFDYSPSIENMALKEKLKCWKIAADFNLKNYYFDIIDIPIEFSLTSNANLNSNSNSSSSTIIARKSCSIIPARSISMDNNMNSQNNHNSSSSSFVDEEREVNQDLKKIINEIDRMLNYLRNLDNGLHSQYNKTSEIITRKISIVISQLRKGPTNDIQKEIGISEKEIYIFKKACEQWELIQNLPNNGNINNSNNMNSYSMTSNATIDNTTLNMNIN